MEQVIPLKVSPEDVKTIRRLNAKINGFFGGRIKNKKRAKASRSNGKLHKAAA